MSTQKLLPCQNNMASSDVRENVILKKLMLTTDGTTGSVNGAQPSHPSLWHHVSPFAHPLVPYVVSINLFL